MGVAFGKIGVAAQVGGGVEQTGWEAVNLKTDYDEENTLIDRSPITILVFVPKDSDADSHLRKELSTHFGVGYSWLWTDPDAEFSDELLAKLDGVLLDEQCQTIRERLHYWAVHYPRVPVLVLTEQPREAALKEYLPLGAMDCLHPQEIHGSAWTAGLGWARLHARFRFALGEHFRVFDQTKALLWDETADRQRLEAELRTSERRYHVILDNAVEAIVTITEEGIIESFNLAAEKIFGYSAEQAISQNVTLLMPEVVAVEHSQYLKRYLETREHRIVGVGREVQGRRRDGSLVPLELSVSHVQVAGRSWFTGIMRDITERKNLQREVLRVAEEEERRIGQDLHDSAGQELTGLCLMADSLQEALAERGTPEVQLASKIANLARRALTHVRAVARGLVPVEVDGEGLMSALADLADRVRDVSGISCDFSAPQVVALDDNHKATHLYRIAQEAVNNAIRHAQPRHVEILLSKPNGTLTLLVRDDGVGIEPTLLARMSRSNADKGMGLRIMHYRASLIDAQLEISRAPRGGTIVTCTLKEEPGHGPV